MEETPPVAFWWGVTPGNLLLALLLVGAGLFARRVLLVSLHGLLAPSVEKTAARWDDELVELLPGPLALMVQLGCWYLAVKLLNLPTEPLDYQRTINQGLELALAVAFTWLLLRLVDVLINALARATDRGEARLDRLLVPMLRRTLKVIVVICVVLMLIQNLGYSVSSLLASLGIGGLALALAAKDAIANVFGSLVVLVDKPFRIGDWVEFAGIQGAVDDVGLRTTRIRRFDRSTVVVPNSTFSTSPIINHSSRPQQRVKFTVGVSYATPPDQMRGLLSDLRRLVREHPGIDPSYFFVNFTDFGDSSLDILCYCFARSSDWNTGMDMQEDLMLRFMSAIEARGLEIAYPTRTVYLREARAAAGEPPPE